MGRSWWFCVSQPLVQAQPQKRKLSLCKGVNSCATAGIGKKGWHAVGYEEVRLLGLVAQQSQRVGFGAGNGALPGTRTVCFGRRAGSSADGRFDGIAFSGCEE